MRAFEEARLRWPKSRWDIGLPVRPNTRFELDRVEAADSEFQVSMDAALEAALDVRTLPHELRPSRKEK